MPGPLQADNELAAALGRATGAWALLESMLTMMFAVMTKLDMTTAVAVFDFFKSTRTQRDVLLRVAKVCPRVTEQQRLALVELMKDYQELATRRNLIAHNPYGWMDTTKQTEVYLMLKARGVTPDGFPYSKRPVNKAEIDTLTEDIDTFRMKLVVLNNAIAGLTLMPEIPQ